MEIVTLPISEIKPYENNPRRNAAGVVAVAKSMREFGVQAPILLDKDRVIVYGHTRLLAAKEIGLTEYPCIISHDLTPEKARAYRIADNAVQDFSIWDVDKLRFELKALEPINFDHLPLMDLKLDRVLNPLTKTVSFKVLDPNQEWEGMPEFEQEDKTSFRHVVVHFRNETDVARFFELIIQKDTGKTRSIWFPPQEPLTTESRRYGDEEK